MRQASILMLAALVCLGTGEAVASPVSLAAGARSSTPVVAYQARIVAASFRALLNGADVTGLFRPAPGRVEPVVVPLRPGANLLELYAEGRDGDQVFSDRDSIRLEAR